MKKIANFITEDLNRRHKCDIMYLGWLMKKGNLSRKIQLLKNSRRTKAYRYSLWAFRTYYGLYALLYGERWLSCLVFHMPV